MTINLRNYKHLKKRSGGVQVTDTVLSFCIFIKAVARDNVES